MKNSINQLVIQRCLEALKQQLKEKHLKYSDIANALNVSENTVKRMLNHKDISLDRLLTLADLCDLEIGKLIDEAKESHNPHYLFTDTQDKAFDEAPHLLSYFSELFFYAKNPISGIFLLG